MYGWRIVVLILEVAVPAPGSLDRLFMCVARWIGAHVKHAADFIQTRRGLEAVARLWVAYWCVRTGGCSPSSMAVA